jgi:beta-aspartyl-dipeptidase (metallo-type)
MQLHHQDSDLFPLALAAMTVNPAAALGLAGLGQLDVGADADFILVDGDSGVVTDVCCGGRWLLREGSVCSA